MTSESTWPHIGCQSDYDEYKQRVKRFFESEGIDHLSQCLADQVGEPVTDHDGWWMVSWYFPGCLPEGEQMIVQCFDAAVESLLDHLSWSDDVDYSDIKAIENAPKDQSLYLDINGLRYAIETVDPSDCFEPAEEYFSYVACDCCNRNLGGHRFDCSGFNPTTKEIQGPYAICVDCLYFSEYGRLDDMTMLDNNLEG